MKRLALALVVLLSIPAKGEEFTDAINELRAQKGLGPVAHDARLAEIAARNNTEQSVRGQGHWVTDGYPQCSYVEPTTNLSALYGWEMWGGKWNGGYIHSHAHSALLFHPAVRRIGVNHEFNRHTVVIAFDDGQSRLTITGARPTDQGRPPVVGLWPNMRGGRCGFHPFRRCH